MMCERVMSLVRGYPVTVFQLKGISRDLVELPCVIAASYSKIEYTLTD